jgi:hypothetical protein
VFYEPGDLDQAGGPTISVDDGCLLQLREGLELDAVPSLALESVTVSVGDRSWAVSLADCGQGGDAGTTVSLGTTGLGFE